MFRNFRIRATHPVQRFDFAGGRPARQTDQFIEAQ
jgi:hypothetical protein